jgi:hypothetical protein
MRVAQFDVDIPLGAIVVVGKRQRAAHAPDIDMRIGEARKVDVAPGLDEVGKQRRIRRRISRRDIHDWTQPDILTEADVVADAQRAGEVVPAKRDRARLLAREHRARIVARIAEIDLGKEREGFAPGEAEAELAERQRWVTLLVAAACTGPIDLKRVR